MKKITVFGLLTVALVATGCSKSSDTIDIFGTKCEKIATFEQGDIIAKCPLTDGLVAIQSQTPNSKFVQGGDLNLPEIATDAEHIYVNFIPAGSYDWATKDEYRVMVKNPNFDGESMWTVSVVIE